jgi:TRAP-type mannitol/chloroaromatic compound transport system permease small subunit
LTGEDRRAPLADRFCDGIDRINSWVGRFWALSIFAVVLAVLYEVVSRSAFGQGNAVEQ